MLNTENPVPDTLTVAPTGAWPGLTEIPGVVTVTVTVTDAVAVLPSESVTSTQYAVVDVRVGVVYAAAFDVPLATVLQSDSYHW